MEDDLKTTQQDAQLKAEKKKLLRQTNCRRSRHYGEI